MQNRSNRNLLFGGRAGDAPGVTTASVAEQEVMEAENQAGVDALRGSAGIMKDVSFRSSLAFPFGSQSAECKLLT